MVNWKYILVGIVIMIGVPYIGNTEIGNSFFRNLAIKLFGSVFGFLIPIFVIALIGFIIIITGIVKD